MNKVSRNFVKSLNFKIKHFKELISELFHKVFKTRHNQHNNKASLKTVHETGIHLGGQSTLLQGKVSTFGLWTPVQYHSATSLEPSSMHTSLLVLLPPLPQVSVHSVNPSTKYLYTAKLQLQFSVRTIVLLE